MKDYVVFGGPKSHFTRLKSCDQAISIAWCHFLQRKWDHWPPETHTVGINSVCLWRSVVWFPHLISGDQWSVFLVPDGWPPANLSLAPVGTWVLESTRSSLDSKTQVPASKHEHSLAGKWSTIYRALQKYTSARINVEIYFILKSISHNNI